MWARIGDYARTLRAFHRDSTAAELSYRGNLVAGVLLSLFWLAWATFGLRVFYRYVNVLNGWRYPEALIVLALFFTLNGVRQALFQPGMQRMTEYIRMGTLDLFLIKPISTQFLVSFRYINPVAWLDCGWGLALGGYAVVRTGRTPGPTDLARFAVLFVVATVLLYCLNFGLQSLTLWTVQSRVLNGLVAGVMDVTRFPTAFYGRVASALLGSVLPVAFVTTIPVEALLGRQGWVAVGVGILLAIAGLIGTRALWRVALRGYQGVSS